MRPGIFVSRTREKLGRTCDQIGRTLEPWMSQCAYLNGSVFLVKTRYFLHENCAKSRELCVVF